MIREAKRNNVSYRAAALRSLGTFADGFETVSIFDEVHEIVSNAVDAGDEDDMDIDNADGKSAKQVQHQTLINGLRALACAFRPKASTGTYHPIPLFRTFRIPVHMLIFPDALSQAKKLLDIFDAHVIGGDVELKTCSVEGSEVFLARLAAVEKLGAEWDEVLRRAWKRVMEHLADKNYLAARVKAVEAVKTVGKVMGRYRDGTGAGEGYMELVKKVREELEERVREEKAPMVAQVLRPAVMELLGGFDGA